MPAELGAEVVDAADVGVGHLPGEVDLPLEALDRGRVRGCAPDGSAFKATRAAQLLILWLRRPRRHRPGR